MGALASQEFDRALRLSIREGAAWAGMVGLAETYFLATAVHLGGGPLALGLTVALPLALGSAGPLATLGVLRRAPERRTWCVRAVRLQIGTLLTMSALLALERLTVPLLITGICLYQMSGQAAGTAWSSWYGDLVPARTRGTWFARRNRVVYLSTCAGLAVAGLILHLIEPAGVRGSNSRIGFAILFALAALARSFSAALLARSPEPGFRGLPRPGQVLRFVRTARGDQAVRVLLLGALFHFAVYWSAPYFAPFMLEDLEFSYAQYMTASLCVIVFKALLTSSWGRLIDRRGAKRVFLATMLLVALVPLPWVFAEGLGVVLLAQAVSGSSWSGLEVSYFSLLLETSTRRTRPFVFAAQSISNGLFQLAGVLVAARLIFPRVGDYRDVFAISVAGRLGLTLAAPLLLLGIRRGPAAVWSRLGLRPFGLRFNGGFSMRPVLAPEPEDPGPEPGEEPPPAR